MARPGGSGMPETVVLRGKNLRLWRLAVVLVVAVPFVGVVAAGAWWSQRGLGAIEHGLFAVFYLVTGLGVTLGYHRLFTHRSFQAKRWLELSLAVCGSMAVQGPLLRWVAEHRRHHQHSDSEDDPHSPHVHGGSVGALMRGFFHAHLGWFFDAERTAARRYAPDLFADPTLRRIDRLYPVWVIASIALPGLIAGALDGTSAAFAGGILWPGLARIFLVQHVTWSVNSICHMFGTRDFSSPDESRNNWFFGLVGLGEGWHNGHHAFPSSARHGLLRAQIDPSYLVLLVLRSVGCVSNLKVPDQSRLAAKRIR